MMHTLRTNETGVHGAGTLTNMINSHLPVLGNTMEGSAWVMKALNPSAPIQCHGLPDMSTGNVVIYKFEQSFAIDAPNHAVAGDSVDYEINLHGDPIRICDVISECRSAPGDISGSKTVLNSQMPTGAPIAPTGTTWGNTVAQTAEDFRIKKIYWGSVAQRARMLYCSMTLTQTANQNNDQGLLHAGQMSQNPEETYAINMSTGKIQKQHSFTAADFATFDNISNLPRSLDSVSRGGVYLPLKLGDNFMRFVNQETPVAAYSSDLVGATIGPHGSVPSPHKFVALPNGTSGAEVFGQFMGQVFIKNASVESSYNVRLRFGWEVVPFAGGSNTPFISESPRYDPVAMEAYSQLVLEVEQDAYPADYNLFEWLGKAIRKVAPFLASAAKGALSNISGGPMGMISGALGGVMNQLNPQEEEEEEQPQRPPPPQYRQTFDTRGARTAPLRSNKRVRMIPL